MGAELILLFALIAAAAQSSTGSAVLATGVGLLGLVVGPPVRAIGLYLV